MSRSPSAPLNIADTYLLTSINNNPIQTSTNTNATANPCQTLYQPNTAPNISPSAISPSSFSTVYPLNPSPVNTQHNSVPFVSKIKSMKTFDGVDHQNTPEECLHRTDEKMNFTMGKLFFDRVAFEQ